MKKAWLRVCSWICVGCMMLGSVSVMAAPVPVSQETPASVSYVESTGSTEAAEPEKETGDFEPEESLESVVESENGENETAPAAESTEAQEETAESETAEAQEETVGSETAEEPQESAQALDLQDNGQQAYLEGFVSRLYSLCLGRDAKESEVDAWAEQLRTGRNNGAEVAVGFIFSEEYRNKKTSDEAYVTMLYQALLGREPDQGGWSAWVERLYEGASRQKVFEGFVNSEEYDTICRRYGVSRGSYTSNEIQDKNPELTSFVVRMYRICLGRKADEEGLKDWVGTLLDGTSKGADIVWGFVNSREMDQKKLSNEAYLDILYQAVMGRAADESGKNSWLAVYDKGVSNRHVVGGFVGSKEFHNLCAEYGIEPGSLSMTEARDRYPEISGFVMRFYQVCMERKPKAEELNAWVEDLASKKASGMVIASGFFFSEEYESKNKSNAQFVEDVYRAMLGRYPDSKGAADWTRLLDQGTARETLVDQISSSQEYVEVCRKTGITRMSNGWQNIGSKWYYIRNDARVSGWQTIDGVKYYFDPSDGNARASGWRYIDGLKYYFNGDGSLCKDLDGIIGKQSSYEIQINRQCNTVTVYAKDGSNGYIIPVKSFICSTGADGATPLGTYYTPAKYRWHALMNDVYGQWCTRIVGGVLFHSVYYHDYTNSTLYTSAYNQLGKSVSHGCVRLTAGDAKWIYDNCGLGTKVTVYESSVAGPYGKPSAYQLPSWHTWDPTDPTAYSKCQARGCH